MSCYYRNDKVLEMAVFLVFLIISRHCRTDPASVGLCFEPSWGLGFITEPKQGLAS